MYEPKTYVLIIVLLAGLGVSYLGFQDLLWLGTAWLSSKAADQWWLNTYTVIAAKDSFLYLGVISLWLGGIFAGMSAVLILTKFSKMSLVPFFAAIVFTGLGFNTLDWMLAGSYSLGSFPLWPFNLSFKLESWNWYIFLGVVPSFLGGLFICMVLTYAALKTLGKI
jgi:hypothetical protein